MYITLCISSYVGLFNQVQSWEHSNLVLIFINASFLIFWTTNLFFMSTKVRKVFDVVETLEDNDNQEDIEKIAKIIELLEQK